MAHQASPANCPSQISALRRLETHNRRKALPESHPSRSGGEAADAEAVELHNPVLGRSGEKVCTRSRSLAYVTEIIVGFVEDATTS